MKLDHSHKAQLWFAFMHWQQPAMRDNPLTVRSQAEVARLMGLTQPEVSRLESSAFRKLRELPEAKILLRWVCQQASRPVSSTVETSLLRNLAAPEDASYLTISGFSPNV